MLRPENTNASLSPNLSKAAEMYAYQMGNPEGKVVCSIPNSPVLNVSTRQVFAKGTFSTSIAAGAGGFGFIVMRPFFMAVNDSSAVVASDATYASNAISDVAAAVAGTQIYQSNSEFATADIGADLASYRLVSAVLKISCISPSITVEGDCTGLMEPNHNSTNGLTVATAKAYSESSTFTNESMVKGPWTRVLYSPVLSTDMDFRQTFPVAPAVDTGFLAFAIDGGSTKAQTFNFEAWADIDFQGAKVTGKVVSPDDPVGHSAVAAAMKMNTVTHKPHQHDGHEVGKRVVAHANAYVAKHVSRPEGHTNKNSKDHRSDDDSDFWGDLWDFGKSVLPAVGSLLTLI